VSFRNSNLLKRAIEALLILILLLSGPACTRSSMIRNKSVVRVNSVDLTAEEFAGRLARKLKDYDALFAKDQQNLKRAKEQTVEEFVLEVLTKQYAKENNLIVSHDLLEQESSKLRSKYPDDIAFRRALSQENISFAQWNKELEYSLLQRLVHAQISKNVVALKESEIKGYYEANISEFNRPARIKLRQILVEKEDVAKRLYTELQEGSDIGKLAKDYSIAPEATNNGVTDWIDKGALDIFDQAFKLNSGQRSKILKSPYGYHIYEVVKKEPEVHLSLQEARARVERQLREKKEQTAFSTWLDHELRKSQVSRNEDMIQAVKVTTKVQ
jgi:peptidyl-prolyl cis-trans isomerase C